MATFHLGVDIAKASFVAALWQDGKTGILGEFANTPTGSEALAKRLLEVTEAKPGDSIHLVLEPTGGYELALALFAYERGWLVSLPNPRHFRDWAKGLGQRAKTDHQDARLLARYGAERKPLPWKPLAAEVSELESLLGRKEEIEEALQRERNRMQALSGRAGVAAPTLESLQESIGFLEQALGKVEEAIKAHLKGHASLRQHAKRLRQVPGIGEKSVLRLLVLLARFDTLTGGVGGAKQLVAYAGLDPTTHESGTSVRGRRTISRMGNRKIRPLLYMCALGGISGENDLRRFHQGLIDRGKAAKVALTASARKILVWAWAVFRSQSDYRPQAITPSVA
jgi:transposase